jgi:LCP family protein required for cell wall assembly
MGRPYWDRPQGNTRGGSDIKSLKMAAGILALLIVTITGFGWWMGNSVHRSWILGGARSGTTGNILIMGLDSRLDENGNSLPSDIYDALHAGDAADGGQNANVLMLIHIPDDGGRATSVSIPRDDYVELPGCPDNVCMGKIKQAYGLAFDAEQQQLAGKQLSQSQRMQQARDAGRKEQVHTVEQFLGGVKVDHFVEVTLVAFFEMAKVVAPITVCVNENTHDSYSGANFHAGVQQINGAQAVAFVRQRRDDTDADLNFSDLDRERRQQAFMVSLAHQLQQSGTLDNPSKLIGIFNVAKDNVVVDGGLDVLGFARQAADIAGNMTFTTLPIDHFGQDAAGEDVNVVDVPAVQAMVRKLFDDSDKAAQRPKPSGTVDVVNANGEDGLAGKVEAALAGKGYTAGATSTDDDRADHSTVYYNGSPDAANALAGTLGGTPTQNDATVPSGHLRVVLGEDFTMPAALEQNGNDNGNNNNSGNNSSGIAPPPILAGATVPCVK